MPKNAAKNSKKVVKEAPKKKEMPKHVFNWLRPSRKLGSGGVLRKNSSLGRLIKWPRYVQLQRQRKILLQRLKIPPSLNIFNNACSRDFASKLVKFSKNYSPETRKQKTLRLKSMAKLQAEGKPIPSEKKNVIKCGFNHVTNLIESGRAKLVIIAHDVDPIELVLWMPALCVKKNVPFVIMKSKARLGSLVHKKTAACLAVCEVDSGDDEEFKALALKARQNFNERYNILKKQWGKKVLGQKTRHKQDKRKRIREQESKKRKEAQKASRK